MWVDRGGKLISNISAAGDQRGPALSHDGRRLAIGIIEPSASNGDVWIIDLVRGTSSRLTFDSGNDFGPIWSPDDRHVLFSSNRKDTGDIYRKAATGLGGDEELIRMPGLTIASDYSYDGRFISVANLEPDAKRGWDIYIHSVAEKRTMPFQQTPFNELNPRFSPDGKWIVYQSDESGKAQVYVQSFPSSGGKWQVSTEGGTRPRWSARGDEIFYQLPGGKLMAVPVKTGAIFEVGIPKALFEMQPKSGPDGRYVVSADGQRFVINNALKDEVKAPVTMVQNWDAGRRR
jgi:Tol biopolymer transport system component